MDKYERLLETKLSELRQCHRDRKIMSCSRCEKYLKCTLRLAYVSSVYSSLSKGTNGGFEF